MVDAMGRNLGTRLGLAIYEARVRVMRMGCRVSTYEPPPPHVRHILTTISIMRPTARCLTPGFMKRSLDEFKRLSSYGERTLHPLRFPQR